MVKVSINDLNIRKGAGTNTAKTGRYTGKGVFTIGCKGEYRAVQIVRYYHVVYQNRVNADAYHNEEALKTDSEQGF